MVIRWCAWHSKAWWKPLAGFLGLAWWGWREWGKTDGICKTCAGKMHY